MGDALGLVVRVLLRNAAVCLAVSSLVALPGAAAGVMVAGIAEQIMSGGPALVEQRAREVASSAGPVLVAIVLLAVASFVVSPVGLSVVAWVGARGANGDRPTLQAARERLAGRAPTALAAFLLTVLAVLAVPVAFAVLAVAAASPDLAVLCLVAFVFPGTWLAVRFSLAPAVAMCEDVRPTRALSRSVELVQGGFWWVGCMLGVSGLAGLLLSTVAAAMLTVGAGPFAETIAQAAGIAVSASVVGVATGVAYAVRSARPVDDDPTG